jgi:hypothetical protein
VEQGFQKGTNRMNYTKQEIIEKLVNGVVMVTFTKVDGSLRVMRCTLCPDYLPARQGLTEVKPRAASPNALSVWDIEANDWRAFNLTTITGVQVL